MRQPGIEPGPPRWQRGILTIELLALIKFFFFFILFVRTPRIELGIFCVLSRRHNQLDQARIFFIKIKLFFFHEARGT